MALSLRHPRDAVLMASDITPLNRELQRRRKESILRAGLVFSLVENLKHLYLTILIRKSFE